MTDRAPAAPGEEPGLSGTFRIDRDGVWHHEGVEVTHAGVLRNLYANLRADRHAYHLQVGPRQIPVQVDDAPFVVLRAEPDRDPGSIRIWLSAGQRAATVPPLVGETERAAQLRLTQDGLTLTGISEIRSQSFAPDVIVAQTPPAKAASGRVALLVNRGERGASYVMPDLIGANGDRAAEILREHGFRVAIVGSTPFPGVAAGVVIRQNPQAGFQVGPGEPISLEVSR